MSASKSGCRVRPVQLLVLVLLAMLVPGGLGKAAEQWKPTKPIQSIVPYAAGGGSDVFARSMASVIQGANLNPTPLIVVNQPGGSSTVGATAVAQSPGNEHMLVTFISGQVAAPLAAGKGAATYHDLTFIARVAIDEQLIVVKADSPFKTIEDVCSGGEAASRRGNHRRHGDRAGRPMCNRIFERAAGVKLRYIPYNSGGEAITSLLGGHTELSWADPGEFFSQWEAKLVRPLVVARETRLSKFSDVPTFKEKGLDVDIQDVPGSRRAPWDLSGGGSLL